MQTFLPYSSFVKSARSLDNKRLGKQRVEVLQLLNAMTGQTRGWGNHPAAKMWRGHELALARYGLIVCHVWRTERSFNDTCFGKIRARVPEATMQDINAAPSPSWLGDLAFHQAHQSNLIRKLPEHYGPQFPGVPNDLPYIWPEEF